MNEKHYARAIGAAEASGRLAGTAAAPQMAVVDRELLNLAEEIGVLDKVVSVLVDKLRPVLGAESPTLPGNDSEKAGADRMLSPVADAIRSAQRRVVSIRLNLDELVERLEV